MRKGILGFFGEKGKDEEKKEEYQNHTEGREVTESRVIVCSGCGAKNLVSINSVCECEYCGSPLVYNADNKTVPSGAAAGTPNTKVSSASPNTVKQNLDLSNIEKEYILGTGFYTAGIDIPVGICNITAVSGSGNLCSSDYGIIEVFGIERGDVSSFKGLKLPKDVSLEVSGKLTIKLVYKSIDDGFSGRSYDMSGATDISAGNYTAGKDFEAGIYNLVAVSGSGNLCTGDIEVNEVFGFEEDDVQEIKNVYLPKGAELSLEGDLTVRLIPAAAK